MQPLSPEDYARRHAQWMRARVSPPEVSPHAGWSGARILLGERLLEVHLLKAAGALEADAPKTSKLARIRERALSTAAMAQVAVPFIELLLPGIPLLRSTSEAGVLSAFVASCFEREGRTWTPQFDHVVAILIARLREAGELHQGEPVGSLLAALQKRGDKRLHMRFEVERLAEQSFRSTFQMPDGELLEGPSRRSKAQAKQAVATLALSRLWAPRPLLLVLMSAAPLCVLYAALALETEAQFWALSCFRAFVAGGLGFSGLNRGLFAQMVPRSRESEFFGLWMVAIKAVSWTVPLLMTTVTTTGEEMRVHWWSRTLRRIRRRS